MLLSHAHIDHSGDLPSLTRHGYQGPIYTTNATADLLHAMLPDSAHIQEKDAEFINKRARRRRLLDPAHENHLAEPLYSAEDAEKVLTLFRDVEYHQTTEIDGHLQLTLYDAGHMLGSAAQLIEYDHQGHRRRLAFSGDVGRDNLPIIRDPEPLPPVDYLIMESTYGDRLHQDISTVSEKLAAVVTRTAARGGRVIVPSFAVGRTQQVVLLLHELMNRKRIPPLPIFVDSPLAVNATEVYRRHRECYDKETSEFLNNGEDPFGFSRLTYIRDVQESKALNDLRGPIIIISASGMCEVGRILHHLKNNIADPRNTVLIVGFQAQNTLGRKIVEKQQEVPIFGEPVRLRAEVVKLNELSGHADQNELLKWMEPLATGLKRVFLVHGEPAQSAALAVRIRERYKVEVTLPARGDSVALA